MKQSPQQQRFRRTSEDVPRYSMKSACSIVYLISVSSMSHRMSELHRLFSILVGAKDNTGPRIYRVIHKSLRDFRTRLRNNQDRHGRKEHINRYRISPSFFVLGALSYFQVPPLGVSREEKWRSQWIRKRSVLEFAKTESIVTVQRRFRIMYHTEPPTDKTIREWYMNSSRVAACALRNEQTVRAYGPFTNCFVCRWFCVVHDLKPPLHSHNRLSFGKFQDTQRFILWTPFFFTTTP